LNKLALQLVLSRFPVNDINLLVKEQLKEHTGWKDFIEVRDCYSITFPLVVDVA